MNALILVGGYGTRLRPLTLTTPKPLINFCNKPIIEHHIFHLSKCGVKEIILAIAYKHTDIKNVVSELEKKYDVRIFYSFEEEPLGTGGPIKLAEAFLEKYENFFVFNSDIICSFPLKEMMEFHKKNKLTNTILVKEVEDPSQFGVVITDGNRIIKFEEKPLIPKSSLINAGIYILSRDVLKEIPKKNTSLEKEIFPRLAECGTLHFYKLPGFWADIGKPLDFLRGQELYLENLKKKKEKMYEKEIENEIEKGTENEIEKGTEKETDEIKECLYIPYNLSYDKEKKKNAVKICNGNENNLFVSFENKKECESFNDIQHNLFDNVLEEKNISGNVLISSKAIINKNCVFGNNVVIGDNVIIEEGCRIKNSCIMNNTKINAYAYIENSIIGTKSIVGSWSRVEGLSVIGESVVINSELFINNVFILPFKEVSKSIYEKGSIIM